MPSNKIVSPKEAKERFEQFRSAGRRVVLAFGGFNFLNIEMIDRLRASVRDDEVLALLVSENAQQQSTLALPSLPHRLRAETAAALPFVELVIMAEARQREDEYVDLLQPSACVSGLDSPLWLPPVVTEREGRDPPVVQGRASDRAASKAGALPLSSEASSYVEELRSRYSADQVISDLRELSGLRVMVLGDAIIDQYHFCRPYGMPMKAPIIAAQFEDGEEYAGGALAVANHVANFCDDVQLVTCLGLQDPKDLFIRRNLLPNVELKPFYRADAPTIVKRRYLQRFLVYRLFELSFYNDSPIVDALERSVCEYLEEAVPTYDLVLVADYGHGFISPKIIDVLGRRSKFIAVNTQTNSINKGYHVVTRYPRVDYVCLDEAECRFACRDRFEDSEKLIVRLAEEIGCKLFTMTRGHHSSLTFVREAQDLKKAPVLSRGVVDTVGAGDAYLSVTAPCAARGFPPELITFVGNCAGAIAVRIMGNKRPISASVLYEQIGEMLG